MSKTRGKSQSNWKRPFWRAFWATLILLGCLTTLFLGTARAYEAVRQNGFGEKVRAIDLRVEEGGAYLRLFDSEWWLEWPF